MTDYNYPINDSNFYLFELEFIEILMEKFNHPVKSKNKQNLDCPSLKL